MCVCDLQKGETPLLKAVNEGKGNIVRYLINKRKMDITQLDQVRLFMYAYVHYFMHTVHSYYHILLINKQ